MSQTVLYDYWRSTASYRVRIALYLADIVYEKRKVDLLAGQQHSDQYLAVNAQGFVPVLEIDHIQLSQSLAIIEYLNETRSLGLLSTDPVTRARMRALAQMIACDTHPVCNPSVLSYVSGHYGMDERGRKAWMQHFIRRGLLAFEAALGNFKPEPFTNGERPGLPEICLVPQLYNATRWAVDFHDLIGIVELSSHCAQMDVFTKTAPAP